MIYRKFKCTEGDCTERFKTPQELGKHRRLRHGIAGPKSSTPKLKRTRGEAHESSSIATIIPRQKTEQAIPYPRDGATQEALAVALGRFQQLSLSFAIEYDLPPRMFARQLAEFIYAASVR